MRQAYKIYVFCFSYLLLHNKTPQILGASGNNHYLFCLWISSLGRVQWGQFISAPCSVSWAGLQDLLSRWHTWQGWQIGANCHLGAQLRLWARGLSKARGCLGSLLAWHLEDRKLYRWPGFGSHRASLLMGSEARSDSRWRDIDSISWWVKCESHIRRGYVG